MLKNIISLILLILTSNLFSQEIEKEYGWYHIKPKDSTSKYLDINGEYFIKNSLITIDYVEKITFINSETRPFKQIQFEFTEEGKKLWEEQSDMFKGKFAGFVFDNQVITIVYITTKINSGRVSFSSENPNFKTEELFEKLKTIVEKQK